MLYKGKLVCEVSNKYDKPVKGFVLLSYNFVEVRKFWSIN